ncbi:CLUMA_CG008129, isoform A, partial [Clunio marinus]
LYIDLCKYSQPDENFIKYHQEFKKYFKGFYSMGSIAEARIEGFICRLCSQIDRNVIHIYTDEGLQKKLEQKINVYLKINLTRFDPLPKVICIPCDAKLEQHHRFIQRVIQNQKKIQAERTGNRPINPQHFRVRVSPVAREDGSGTNTYNIEAISSSESEGSDSEIRDITVSNNTSNSAAYGNQQVDNEEDNSENETQSDNESSSSSSSSDESMNNDEPLVGFSPNLEPVNASWSSSGTHSSSSTSDSNQTAHEQEK